jgi:hypothetical protein
MSEQQITAKLESETKNYDEGLKGLGGWLVLIGIGIVLAPLKLSYFVYTVYRDIFANGAWSILTDIGSDFYTPYFGTLVIIEILINIMILIVSLFLAYKFFTKKKSFPKWFIGISIFSLVFLVADTFAVSVVFPDEEAFDPATMKELALSFARAGIWIPYMLVSKRVKATFIN